MPVNSARAGKHQPLNNARSLNAGDDGLPLEDTLEGAPVAVLPKPRRRGVFAFQAVLSVMSWARPAPGSESPSSPTPSARGSAPWRG
jgi:hypothetical protein